MRCYRGWPEEGSSESFLVHTQFLACRMRCWPFPGRWWCRWRTWCDGLVDSLQTGVAARRGRPVAPTASTNLRRAATKMATATAAIHSKWKQRVRRDKETHAGPDIATWWCTAARCSIIFSRLSRKSILFLVFFLLRFFN